MTNPITRMRERARVIKSFRRVFDTPDGKEVLRFIMKQGFVLESTFVAGDPQQTSLNEGSRRLALSILRAAYKDEKEVFDEIERLQQEG